MGNEKFIAHDFKLPNHENELSKADEVIKKLKIRFNKHKKKKELSDKDFLQLYEETARVLDYVGQLSMYAFEIEDEMEELYILKYIHAPQLGRMLWQEHYGNVHHPYNIFKNRCFKLLEELDNLYQIIHSKYPPNWKP